MIKVKITKDGPAIIEMGDKGIEITMDGKITPKFSPVAICRCGKSTNQPYCNGSHKKQTTTTE